MIQVLMFITFFAFCSYTFIDNYLKFTRHNNKKNYNNLYPDMLYL